MGFISHDRRSDRSEQPRWDVSLLVLFLSRSVLVSVRKLEVILGRASLERIHWSPVHIRVVRFAGVFPRFTFPSNITTRRRVRSVTIVPVIIARRFRWSRIRRTGPRVVHRRVYVVIIRPPSLDRFFERVLPTGGPRTRVKIDYTRAGRLRRNMFQPVPKLLRGVGQPLKVVSSFLLEFSVMEET